VTKSKKEHLAHVSGISMKMAVCPCGFSGPWRDYIYEAKEDIYDHYTRSGRMESDHHYFWRGLIAFKRAINQHYRYLARDRMRAKQYE
jgi:hypothetical protein